MRTLTASAILTERLLRIFTRQPWFLAFTLAQPILWLLLHGQLFQKVADLPGFDSGSYISFLTPGIIMMSALFAAGWSGMGLITDIDRGTLDRFLISPAPNSAIIWARLLNLSVTIVVQTLILIGIGWALGATYSGGVTGLVVLFFSAILLGLPFGALSTALALSARKHESVMGAVNFVMLPLTFLSGAFMNTRLVPQWIQWVAVFNPVNWSLDIGRGALVSNVDWDLIAIRLIWLTVFLAISLVIAFQSFRNYRRSI